jgi:hypothetical protein
MKNVYLFQISSFSYVEGTGVAKYIGDSQSIYFPYALGLIWSYAKNIENIKKNYVLKNFEIFRKNIDEVLDYMESPDIVACSNYIWNDDYHLMLLEEIKKKWPNCKTIVGGPSVSKLTDWYDDKSFIDFSILAEGEIIFSDILIEHLKESPNYEKIPGMFLKKNGKHVNTGKAIRILDLDQIPSPYLTGVFDDLCEKYSDIIDFHAPIETNRGCPFKCTYCDWGGLIHQKMKFYDLERTKSEIDWTVSKKIPGIILTDSNLGMFKRDLKMIDYIVDSTTKTGYPRYFHTAGYSKTPMGKNWVSLIQEKVNSVSNTLGRSTFAKPHVAIQSFDETVLKYSKRKNLDISNSDLLEDNKLEVDFSVELIFPLPGSTYETMKNDIDVIMQSKFALPRLFPTVVLPKSELNSPEYKKLHGIKTVKVPYNHAIHEDFSEIDKEYIFLIESTKYCSKEEIVYSWLYFWAVMRFWWMPTTEYITVSMKTLYGVKYITYFDSFLFWMKTTDGWLNENFYSPLSKIIMTSNYSLMPDHNSNNSWVDLILNNIDFVYEDVSKFLKDVFNLEKYEIEILIEIQKNKFKHIEIASNGWRKSVK